MPVQARQGGADWIGDTKCAAYGLDEQAITGLRPWAQAWANDSGNWKFRTKTDGLMEACRSAGCASGCSDLTGRAPSVPSEADNSGQVRLPKTGAIRLRHAKMQVRAATAPENR
jgi:hypothetical protein